MPVLPPRSLSFLATTIRSVLCNSYIISVENADISPEERILLSVQEENEQTVAAMAPEEREQERQELLARFGGGLAETLRKRKEARGTASTCEWILLLYCFS